MKASRHDMRVVSIRQLADHWEIVLKCVRRHRGAPDVCRFQRWIKAAPGFPLEEGIGAVDETAPQQAELI